VEQPREGMGTGGSSYLALTSAQKREALGELFLLLATRFNSEYEFGRHLKNSRIV